MDDVGIFLVHLVYFTAFGFTLWTFGIFCGNLVCFPPFWYMCCAKKNLATLIRNQ
jgi:hypothetical protein